jgi:hypothetical protein
VQDHGFGVFVLPILEEEDLYRLYNFNHDSSATPLTGTPTTQNHVLVTTRLKVIECPSTPSPKNTLSRSARGYTNFTFAPGDYGPLSGVRPALAPQFIANLGTTASLYRGVLDVVNPTNMPLNSIANVTDGTSNTILLAEVAGRPNVYFNGRLDAVSSAEPYTGSGPFANGAGGAIHSTSGRSTERTPAQGQRAVVRASSTATTTTRRIAFTWAAATSCSAMAACALSARR